MGNSIETYLGLLSQVYGLALIVLGAVVFVLPREDTNLPFAPHLGWLAGFGLLHGMLQFIDYSRSTSVAVWLAGLSSALLASSFLALLEFGRRAWNDTTTSHKLPFIPVYSLVAAGIGGFMLSATSVLEGMDVGIRFMAGAPGALLSGLTLIAIKRVKLRGESVIQFTLWLRVSALGLAIYALLILFVSGENPGIPAWIPTEADFEAITGLPVRLGHALCAGLVATGFIMIIRNASRLTGEALLRVVDTLDGFIYRDQFDWRTVYMTNGVEKLTGYPAREFLQEDGRSYNDLIHSEDFDRVWEETWADLNASQEFEIHYRIVNRDGDVRWVYERGRGIYDLNGKLRYLEGHIIDETQRKQAEQLLLETSELNERIVGEAPIGMVIFDSNGQCIAANNAYAEMVGGTQEQLLAQNYNNVEPWKKSGLADAANNSIEQQQKVRGEFEILTTFGRHLTLDGYFVPFVSLGEQHLLFMIDDITGRRQTQQELDKHRHQLELMVDERTGELKQAQDELVMIVDTLNGYIYRDAVDKVSKLGVETEDTVYITNGVEKLTGYSVDEFMGKEGKTFPDIILPEDSEWVWAKEREAVSTHKEFELNYRIRTRNGEVRWVYERGHGVYDQNGELAYVEGYVMDDHERKKAEAELDRYRDDLEQLVEERAGELEQAQDELVMIIDTLHGYVYRDVIDEVSNETEKTVYMTNGVEKLTGYSAAEFVGKEKNSVPDLILPEDSEMVWDKVRRAINTHQEFESNHRIRTRDGQVRWVYERGHGVYDENGVPRYIGGYIIDDHERKKAEAELVKYHDHLEQLVEERTRELEDAQSELLRKGRLATLGQLTATVSHELRNPLGALRTSIYTIKKRSGESADDKLTQAIQRADRTIDRCDRIIDELLDFTRITDLNRSATRIDEWLDMIITEMDIPPGIELEKEYSLTDMVLPIDADRLRRAVINVVENACQSMLEAEQPGRVIDGSCLSIKTSEINHGITLSITDTGTGIAEDVMAKIFEPLFSTKGFGVGLGMSIVKQIVEQHEGNIEIESEAGKGTMVTIWLPQDAGTGEVAAS